MHSPQNFQEHGTKRGERTKLEYFFPEDSVHAQKSKTTQKLMVVP